MISIVIPVKNAENSIKETISAVMEQSFSDFEIIAVDDHSEDSTLEILKDLPVKVYRNKGIGVSSARNTGAEHANGNIIYFIDSDVLIPKNALSLIIDSFKDRRISGVVGIESTDAGHKGFFSQFKNLWMNYTFANLSGYVHSFYTSSAAIHKKDFVELGGFDTNYLKPNVEDTAFGRKMANNGYLSIVQKKLRVIHKKEYTLKTLIKTDFTRTRGLLKIVLREKWQNFQRRNQSSVPLSFILSVPFPAFALAVLMAYGRGGIMISFLLLFIYLYFNKNFLIFVAKKKGPVFLLKALLFMVFDSFIVLSALFAGFFSFFILRRHY